MSCSGQLKNQLNFTGLPSLKAATAQAAAGTDAFEIWGWREY